MSAPAEVGSSLVGSDRLARMASSSHRMIHVDAKLRPVVRWAQMMKLTPPPSPTDASSILLSLNDCWDLGVAELLQRVGKLPFITGGVVSDAESVRIRYDGKTPLVDFPEVIFHHQSGEKVSVRVSIAVCTDEFSSKLWARVALAGDTDVLCDPGDLVADFRTTAIDCSRWTVEIFKQAVRESCAGISARRNGLLEVSAMAVSDMRARSLLRKLADSHVTANDLFSMPDAGELLTFWMSPLDIDTGTDGDGLWLSSPVTVTDDDGYMETRDSLFVLRELEDRVQLLGVVFDETGSGDVARDTAQRVSRWVANRV